MDNISFIKNKIIIDLKNTKKESLLVNLLYGLVDLLSFEETQIINKWIITKNICPNGCKEEELYNQLKNRFYFLSPIEENRIRSSIIKKHNMSILDRLTYSKSASFIFSYNCNFGCPYCYENNRKDSNKTMTYEMVDRVLSLYKDGINHIGFFGGEPLLPQNKKLIQYVINKVPNAYYTVITNGYYLNEFITCFKKIKIAMIQITLDGNEAQHNKTRILKNGNPTYKKIMTNIELCVNNKIPVKIRMNLTHDNIQECFEERDKLLKKFGNRCLSFEMQPLFKFSYLEQMDFINDMLLDDKKTNSKNIIWSTLPPLSNFIFNKKPFYPIVRFCESESQNRFYDNHGNIYACILSVGENDKSIGSFYPHLSLKETSLMTYNIENTECSDCNYALICGGGCPYYVMNEQGNFMGVNCLNIKNEIENLIPTLYKQIYGE